MNLQYKHKNKLRLSQNMTPYWFGFSYVSWKRETVWEVVSWVKLSNPQIYLQADEKCCTGFLQFVFAF